MMDKKRIIYVQVVFFSWMEPDGVQNALSPSQYNFHPADEN